MSALDDLKAWYEAADARGDGNWAPGELARAAVNELVERGVDEWTATVVISDEIREFSAELTRRRHELARRVLKSIEAPGRIVRIEQILEERAKLEAAGLNAGEDSIAKSLNVHPSTVRRVRQEAGEVPWKR